MEVMTYMMAAEEVSGDAWPIGFFYAFTGGYFRPDRAPRGGDSQSWVSFWQ